MVTATARSTGMSKTDFRHWKAEQTARTKGRLQELEERLKRLHLLNNNMQKLRASSAHGESSDTVGGMDMATLSANPYAQGGSPLAMAPLTTRSALRPGGSYEPQSALVSAVTAAAAGGTLSRGGNRPVSPRPVSPGTIRRIIRSTSDPNKLKLDSCKE